MYYSLVYPHLLYGILVWGGASDTHLEPLVVLQKRIIRNLTLSEYRAHTKPLFFKCRILRVDDLYRYAVGVYMFNKYASGTLEYPDHLFNTRSRNNALVSYPRLSQCRKSLTYIGCLLYTSDAADE